VLVPSGKIVYNSQPGENKHKPKREKREREREREKGRWSDGKEWVRSSLLYIRKGRKKLEKKEMKRKKERGEKEEKQHNQPGLCSRLALTPLWAS
jgi:hypothetical protein